MTRRPLTGVRALIVEDNESTGAALTHDLAAWGIQTELRHSTAAA
jgi:hypothetical protein